MNAIISNETVFRIQKLLNKPLSRGFDKAISEILDSYENLERNSTSLKKVNPD